MTLLVGLLLAAFVGVFMDVIFPQSVLDIIARDPIGSLFVMLILSLPIYVCSTASIPLAAGFLFAGFSPGSVLVFLLAGPATNIATMAVIGKNFGKRFLSIYLASIIITAMGLGVIVNWIYSNFISMSINIFQGNTPTEFIPYVIRFIFAIVLVLLMAYGIYRKSSDKKKFSKQNKVHGKLKHVYL